MKLKEKTKDDDLDVRVLEVIPRPDVPYELDSEQAAVWRSVVDAMPADHFTSANLHLLVKLCKHMITGRRLDALVDAALKKRTVDEKQLSELMRMRNMETKAVIALSRQMRLTQQSIGPTRPIRGVTSTRAHLIEAPWNKDDDEA